MVKAKQAVQSEMDKIAQADESKLVPFKVNDPVKCNVISISGNRLVCDIGGMAVGFVPEKEFSFDTKDLESGDEITASVMSMEGRDGMVVLSLRRADRDRLWETLKQKMEDNETLTVRITSANRGGLMVDAGGLIGFLPVSQLSVENYPRVEGGDSNQILYRLKKLIGNPLTVKIIGLDRNEEKLIFSEKEAVSEAMGGVEALFDVGEVVEGTVSGIAPFGVFVNLNSIEGLIHISEVSWEHVSDLNKIFKTGQKVKAKIVKIEDGKVSLSVKRLSGDPWLEEMKKLKVGQTVDGEVTKMTAYGAFVRLESDLEGLVHISKTSGDVEKIKKLQIGDKKKFEVIELKPEARRIGLRLVE